MAFHVWIIISFYSSIWTGEKKIDAIKKQRQEMTDEACEIYQVLVYPCYFPCTRCGNMLLEGNLKETSKR